MSEIADSSIAAILLVLKASTTVAGLLLAPTRGNAQGSYLPKFYFAGPIHIPKQQGLQHLEIWFQQSRYVVHHRKVSIVPGNMMSSASMAFRPERQLVFEWYTPSLEKSMAFLQALGFKVLRAQEAFAEMSWGSSPNRLLVEQMEEYVSEAPYPGTPAGYHGYHGNLRILVADVDDVYQVAVGLKDALILKTLDDRYYGLRDFTVGGPYGLALRFATPLPGFSED